MVGCRLNNFVYIRNPSSRTLDTKLLRNAANIMDYSLLTSVDVSFMIHLMSSRNQILDPLMIKN